MGFLGILVGLSLLMLFAFRGWAILLLAPGAALIAAAFAGEPLLAHWTQTFMIAASGFVAQFFPIFLLGALVGNLMDDSGAVKSIADFMTDRLGPRRAALAVVLAGALVTYGGVSLFVAFFVLAPMGLALFKAGDVPRRLLPAAMALGTSTFTMSALPGTPAIQNAIPMPFFGTTPFAAPGLGVIAAMVMFGFGMWWLQFSQLRAKRTGEGFGATEPGESVTVEGPAENLTIRELATTAREFDPAVVRPARLGDLVVEFGPPDRERRRLILGDHLGETLDSSALDRLADRSHGFSGAEVELLCRRVRWAQKENGDEIGSRLERLVAEVRPMPAGPTVGFRRE